MPYMKIYIVKQELKTKNYKLTATLNMHQNNN